MLRNRLVSEAECRTWDTAVCSWWERQVGEKFGQAQRYLLFLPRDKGGFGLQSAELRRGAARLGALSQVLGPVGAILGVTSATQLFDLCPGLARSVEQAVLAHRAFVPSFAWDGAVAFAEPLAKQQHLLMEDVHKALEARLRSDHLDEHDQGVVWSGGGKSAGDFLLPPVSVDAREDAPALTMTDDDFLVSVRARLLLANAAFLSARHAPATIPASQCNHTYAATPGEPRKVCGQRLDAYGEHAELCNVGGGPMRWHNAIRDWLAQWVQRVGGTPALTEQRVPQWDRAVPQQGDEHVDDERTKRPDARQGAAYLDVTFTDTRGVRTYVDVVVANAMTTNSGERKLRASEPGRAVRLACARKRRRYDPQKLPGCSLIPFAVEAAGRVSEDALALISHMVPHGRGRGKLIAQARQELSILVQQRRAQLLLSAEQQYAPA